MIRMDPNSNDVSTNPNIQFQGVATMNMHISQLAWLIPFFAMIVFHGVAQIKSPKGIVVDRSFSQLTSVYYHLIALAAALMGWFTWVAMI